MDALDLLIADHDRVRGLFTLFRDAKERGATDDMARSVVRIFEDLQVHTTIEEEIFYPWAREHGTEIDETVDEGIQEHHVVKVLMGEIADLEPGDDEWQAKVTVLIENVEHHADEEEEEMFPPLRGASSADEREELGRRLDERKGQLGAPTLDATMGLTMDELRTLATAQEIPGRSTFDHDALAARVHPG